MVDHTLFLQSLKYFQALQEKSTGDNYVNHSESSNTDRKSVSFGIYIIALTSVFKRFIYTFVSIQILALHPQKAYSEVPLNI